ncbi:acyl-CoA dehydrogenase [Microtetraspora sp. NBRC 13810]|uniref:acyl-CoA dehydrogenase family protein n=1 Tax=Microtetraspora sp. NBRC 13810 TaxID=3030990 RepID=UPI002552D833|nr:acyl-CoA dehydrogenase [Microtetraspora sp. NBRC 13810]
MTALTGVLFGERFGETHDPWRRLFATEPFRDDREPPPEESGQRAYRRLGHLNAGIPSAERLVTDVELLAGMHEWAAVVDCGLAVIAGIHYNLFLGSLLDHDPHESRSLREFVTLRRTGVFLCTELAHGNGAAQLETTAEFDAAANGFVLHTPHPGAQKYMPNTSLVGGPKSAVVAARLVVDGEDRGVFLFLTPLSDERGHLPGVRVSRLPGRMGAPVDHCLTSFDRVRLPRHALLESDRGRLVEGGFFTSAVDNPRRRFLGSIARVTTGKLCMSACSLGGTRMAMAIAIRYAHTRHTSGLSGGQVPLFAYRSHHARLLGALATTYAATLLHRTAVRRWAGCSAGDRAEAENLVGIAKGWVTWQAREVLTECRERCGAQGLFWLNGIAGYLTSNELAITAEGDNLPIWLKAAGRMILGQAPVPPPAPAAADLTDPRFLQHLLAGAEEIWDRRARTALERCADPDPLGRWNAASAPALQFVGAHAQRLAGDAMATAAERTPHAEAARLLRLLHRLFALPRISACAGDLVAAGRLPAELVGQLPVLLDATVAELAPHARVLTDAFAIPEELLHRFPLADPSHDAIIERLHDAQVAGDGGVTVGSRP